MDPDLSKNTCCVICLEDLYCTTEDTVTTLPCKHAFHSPCLFPYVQHGLNQRRTVTCPICRGIILHMPVPMETEENSESLRILVNQNHNEQETQYYVRHRNSMCLILSMFAGFLYVYWALTECKAHG